MFQNKQQLKNLDLDDRKNPLMTLRTVKFYCQKEGLFSTPQHNDKLYLQYKGFTKIIPETISKYCNVVALWLNNNAIVKIQGLNFLVSLKSLALNNNFITKIQGLQNLFNLSILNLSHNKIELVQGLESLRALQTINLSQNFIIHAKSLQGLSCCESLSSIDLSQNQLQNSEQTAAQIIKNRQAGCLYLKATPFARGFKNYRKKLIASLKRLKFLDDRPVLEQDHRLAEAWLQGGVESEQMQKQKLAEEKLKKQAEEREHKIRFIEHQNSKKSKPQGFIASVKETSIRIMNVESQQQQERIINQYYQIQKQQIEKNILRKKEEEQKQKAHNQYYQSHETEVIAAKVNQILGIKEDKEQLQEQNRKLQKRIQFKWNPKYEEILQVLLLRYKFDFSQVQPSFNMVIANINKKVLKPQIRFEINELRKIWTQIQLRKRNLNQ